MSFNDCIVGHLKTGFIPESRAKEIVQEYESILSRYTDTLGEEGAHQAAEYYAKIKHNQITKKIENDIGHIKAQQRVTSEINQRRAAIAASKEQAAKGGKWLYGHPTARATREYLQKIYNKHNALEEMAARSISDFVEKFRSTHAGLKQDTAGMKEVVRELGGVSTGNKEAAIFGKAVREVFDVLHSMYEDAGGILGKVDNYFPQVHTPELVGRATFKEWSDFMLPLLDRERMLDLDTGLPMGDARLLSAMKEAYESIRTNGLIDVAERAADGKQTFGRGGEVNMRHSSARFFHFKDIDDFLIYNEKFGSGEGGLFGSVMGHISSMTRDIAIMQELGPKPNAVMKNMELKLQGDGAMPLSVNAIKGMYDTLAGRNSYHGELPPVYKAIAGWLNLKRAAYLGSAPISAMSDTFFIGMAAKMNGLSSMNTLGRYLQNLNPADARHRKIARRHLFTASAASGMSLQGARFADDLGRGGITSFLAGVTNRASGLAAMTDSGRNAIGLELAGVLADVRETGIIDPALLEASAIYGVTPDDWKIMMAATPEYMDEVDADFMFPESIAKLGGDHVETAVRFQEWFTGMSMVALNEPTLLTRAITTGAIAGDARPGTLNRMIFSNIFFAKSFPITVMINHLLPSMRAAAQGRMGQMAALAIGTTVFGAFALQARQISAGKDPQDMTNPKFMVQAMLQGGGLGLFGDFMFKDYNRFGNSLGGTLAGPVIGSLESILKIGDLDSLGTDESLDKQLADTWKLLNREIPTVRLWYTRLLVERLMLDQVERALNPAYDKKISKIEKRLKKQQGQGFWWKPGKTAPSRAPELETAIGE